MLQNRGSRAFLTVRRLASAARAPLCALALMVLIGIALEPATQLDPRVADAFRAGVGVAVALAVWLAVALVWAGFEPRRDAAAAERLTLLRDGASTPGCVLVQIATITWTGAAGTRALCVDVTIGATHDLWFPEAALPASSFVLARLDEHVAHVVDIVSADVVGAAQRHNRLLRQLPQDGDAARAAERLLNRPSRG